MKNLMIALVILRGLQLSAAAQTPAAPAAMFHERCAACHGDSAEAGAGQTKAPPLAEIRKRQLPSRAVMRMIDGAGLMSQHARGWNSEDRQRVAEWITGRPLTIDPSIPTLGRCSAAAPALDKPFKAPYWNGWGVDATNGRFQPADRARLPASDIPKLRLKWAFGFPNGASAFSQPTIAGGRVFVGSDTGVVYAIDARTGCFYWTFQADAAVRTAPVIAESKRTRGGSLVYIGDFKSTLYALDGRSGELVWKLKADDHPATRITGSPTFAAGRLYVPISGVGEEGGANNPATECCTVRGAVVAVDADTGRPIWKSYSIPDAARAYGKTEQGAVRLGPSGASIWAAPTVDLERRAVYVGTGNAFTPPAADTTDAVLAFALDDGRLLWKRQLTAGDLVGSPDAPDVDIGASLILRKLPGAKSVLVVGQKSGDVYGLDPANGAVSWKVNVSRGGYWGGIEWGMAADDRLVYVPVSDVPIFADPRRKSEVAPSPEAGRLIALRLEDGRQVWMQNGVVSCPGGIPTCHPGKTAAVTAIPDAVFAGGIDGIVRAYATTDGRVLWEFNTAREFTTVNGIRAAGASISGPGPTVAGGMVFVSSGYQLFARPGNVLLAFAAE